MRLWNWSLAAALLVSVGCDVNVNVGGEKPAAEGDGEAVIELREGGGGTNIQIPALGVDIKGEGGKWDVKAPGTDVKVDEGKVQVEAPGASVNVE